jgi:hypothetical protein
MAGRVGATSWRGKQKAENSRNFEEFRDGEQAGWFV